MPAIVYLVSGQTAHGRTERVLVALRAAGCVARLVYPTRDGRVSWPTLTTHDIFILHYGSIRHSVADAGLALGRRANCAMLMIRSLNVRTIVTFVLAQPLRN